MSGGRGARLMPLTRDRTKPAVPSGEIYRFINFTLSNCVNSGIYKRGIKSKAPIKAGKEQGVKVPRMVMDSDQPWPRVMRRLPVTQLRAFSSIQAPKQAIFWCWTV
jgi:hypothetical protein